MNTQVAREIIRNELAQYEAKTYGELVTLIGQEVYLEKQGSDGAWYQVEISILWDSTPQGAVYILASIDDGGWRAFIPITDSILKYPS